MKSRFRNMSHDTNEWKTIEQCVKAFTNCTQIALLIGIYIFKRYDLLLRPDSGKYHLSEELQNKTNDVTIARTEDGIRLVSTLWPVSSERVKSRHVSFHLDYFPLVKCR